MARLPQGANFLLLVLPLRVDGVVALLVNVNLMVAGAIMHLDSIKCLLLRGGGGVL